VTLELVAGADPGQAVEILRSLIHEAENGRTAGVDGPASKRQLDGWGSLVESKLRSSFGIVATMAFINTQRYMLIQAMDPSENAMKGAVYAEMTSQAKRLEEIAEHVERKIAIFKAAPGRIVVPDTTAVLRMRPLTVLDLTKITGGEEARLVLPLRVVEELDAKKYGKDATFRNVVRNLLPKIENLLDGAGGPVAQVTSKLTIEILLPPGPRRRIDDADGEILDVCLQLRQFTGQEVTVLTLDTAMRTRARASGLQPVRPTADLLRGSEVAMQAEAEKANPE